METSSIASTSSRLVFLQIISKLATFLPNQLIVRIASPEAYGTAAIQFELVLTTILFLSREGVRNASLRTDKKDRTEAQENTALIPFLVGVPLTILVSSLYFWTSTSASEQPYFTSSVIIISFAAILDLLCEPFFIRTQTSLQINTRVRAEGTAIVTKSLVSLAILLLGSKLSLLAFAFGQVGSSVALMVVYWREFGSSSQRTLALKRTTSKG